jgi:ABC transporter substrate binding protein (PQQ-dependent alcohol dehydrogenase system)
MRFSFLKNLTRLVVSLVALSNGHAVERVSDHRAEKLIIDYLTQEKEPRPRMANLDPLVTDRGVRGARLAIQDNNTTGRFIHQAYVLNETVIPLNGDVIAAFKKLAAASRRHVVVDLPADAIARLAALPEAKDRLIYNVAASDDGLRAEMCSVNVLHLIPSRAMRADALAQYLMKKRWTKWLLVVGPAAEDRLYGDALKRSVKRFGIKLVDERNWEHSYDSRRTAQSEVAVFSQGVEYDILTVADEAGLFGDYLSYRTWLPRLVAGTQGLVPSAWHRTHEQWGAVQLQNRFRDQAGRWMTEEDYAAWLAVRAIGEAATRTQSVDFDKIRAYLLSDEFALAGFKGVPLSFRRWDHQLRQPILLAAERSLVAVAPIEGFLHPKNELDTLGHDEPESRCRFETGIRGNE